MKNIYLVKEVKSGSFSWAEVVQVTESDNLAYKVGSTERCYWFTSKKAAEEKARVWNIATKRQKEAAISDFLHGMGEELGVRTILKSWKYIGQLEVTITGSIMTIKDTASDVTAVIYKCGHWGVLNAKTGSKILFGTGYDIVTAWENLKRGYDPEVIRAI